MSENTSRIGMVSSIDYKNGTMRVTYPSLNNAVTDDLPIISMGGEYKMPSIGDEVLVIHLSDRLVAGCVLGEFWGDENKPAEYGENIFRKELAKKAGDAYLRYKNGVTELKGQEAKLTCSQGSVTASQLLGLIKRVEDLEKRI